MSKLILKSNLKKLLKNEDYLQLVDETFKEQTKMGIIERVENVEQFMFENPDCSFLPHMAVLKPNRATTKCRVVYLSNLYEIDKSKPATVSHNMAILPGPSLNQKLSTALIHNRFDEKLLCFDLVKAFNQINLNESDQRKTLFLWYKNIEKKDFSIVAYKHNRLNFGLRCAPTLLLLALYKILILDAELDENRLKNLKKQIYSLLYMDNASITANSSQELEWAYNQLNSIFSPYQFSLQQFYTNDSELQNKIDQDVKSEEIIPEKVNLLGLNWDRKNDLISTRKIELNLNAKTKRAILTTIASQYDLYNFNGPIMIRSRLFLHDLQCKKDLGWDDELNSELIREWRNIVKQANATPEIQIKRAVGRRDDSYRLIAFSDSSKRIFGSVVYLQNLRTNEVNFIMAKNRIVNTQLQTKSIPQLEFNAISLGTEMLILLFKELTGPVCLNPIKIENLTLYSDSLVSLAWLNAHVNKFEKMQRKSIFVMNRLNHISKLTEIHPVNFAFVSGVENPSDCITRQMSFKQYKKSCYLTGPKFLSNPTSERINMEGTVAITIPNPLINNNQPTINSFTASTPKSIAAKHLIDINRFSDFSAFFSVHKKMMQYSNNLKRKLKRDNPDKFKHFKIRNNLELHTLAYKQLIKTDQEINFPEVFEYFLNQPKGIKNIPNIVKQLNLYLDSRGVIRVKSKFNRGNKSDFYFPILMHKQSALTRLIVENMHEKTLHSGCFPLLTELRKNFYIPSFFAVVRKILRRCTHCKRYNSKPLQLNQSPYRELRLNPSCIPFRDIYMDYFGSYTVNSDGKNIKVYILCITCMWSRAVNLKICYDLSNSEFLRAFQMHTFQYGIPSTCTSDLGSQITSCGKIITNYLNEADSQAYLAEHGIESVTFDQYYKNCSQLGSLVEICVKMSKRLISG